MRKARSFSLPLSIKLPSKRVRERFLIVYELEGCQKALNYLTEYYGVKRMRIVLDGKRVGKRNGNGWVACYLENKAYFIKEGLNRRVILHELYHHLIATNGYEIKETIEEKEADKYARDFTKKNYRVQPKGQGR